MYKYGGPPVAIMSHHEVPVMKPSRNVVFVVEGEDAALPFHCSAEVPEEYLTTIDLGLQIF